MAKHETFTFIPLNLSRADRSAVEAHAQQNYEHAIRIARGGIPAGHDYAESFISHHFPHWPATSHRREESKRRIARDAIACSHAIVARGVPFFVHGDLLCTATLTRDAMAGATGYCPLVNISRLR